MERIFNNITDTEQELIITLSRDEVEPVIQRAIKDISKKVHLDGFRPGKVPLHLVKKMYGESIEYEEHTKLAQKFMEQIFNDDKVIPVSQPHLHDIIKKDGGIEFSLHYEYIPHFDLGDYKTLTVDEPVHRVTDEEIEQHLEMLSYSHGIPEVAEVVEDKDYLVYFVNKEDYEKYISNPDNNPENYKVDRIFLRRKNIFSDLVDKFINCKVGDVIEWHTPKEIIDSNIVGVPAISNYLVKEIKKITPAVLDDEFAKKVSKQKFSSIEDFREEIGLSLQAEWDKRGSDYLTNNIISALLEMHDIKLPKSIIQDEAQSQLDNEAKEKNLPNIKLDVLDEKDREAYLLRAEKAIKFSLIKEKIIEVEAIEVEEHDIDNFIDEMFKGMESNQSQIEYFRNLIRENKNIINQIIGNKVMDLLKDFTTTNEIDFADSVMSFNDDFIDDFEDEDEDEDIFDADEELFDEEEFDGEFFDEDELEEEFDDEWEEVDDDEELDEEEFDDDDASSKK